MALSYCGFAFFPHRTYLDFTPTAFEFCLPTAAKAVPDGPDRLQEIKYDGYRLRVERQGRDVRLLTRNGHNWTRRFPWIVEAALKNREQHFVIDGEAVVLGVDGVSDFNALHSRKHDAEVQLCAFDVLALGGDDLRPLPLSCARPTWRGCHAAGRTACSSRHSRPAKSGRTCFARPAA